MAASPSLGLTEEQQAIAELAFELGQKYADRRFDDHEASLAQWDELAASGLTGLSLPRSTAAPAACSSSARRRAARGRRLPRREARDLDRDRRHDPRAPRDAGAAASAGFPGIAAGTTRFCFALTEPGAGSNSRTSRRARERVGRRLARHRREDVHLGARVVGGDDARRAGRRERRPVRSSRSRLPARGHRVRRACSVDAPAFEYQWSVFFDVRAPRRGHASASRAGARRRCSTGSTPSGSSSPRRRSASAAGASTARSEYARERVVFDVPIGAHQAVQHPLAEALIAARGRVGAARRALRGSTTRASRPAWSRTSRRSPPATPASSPPTARCRPSAAAASPTTR